MGWAGFDNKVRQEAHRWAQLVPELPRLLHGALKAQASPAIDPEHRRLLEQLAREQRRTSRWLQVAVLLMTAILALLVWFHLRQ